MSAAPLLPAEALRRKRFTRSEVDRLEKSGVFEGQRYELIDGDLMDKMGQNPPHAFLVQNIADCMFALFGRGRVRVQLPMEASAEDQETSLPEPDLVLLKGRAAEYRQRHPRGDEVLLSVEVSDTTADFDLTRKALMYGKAGVPEYWVVDLTRSLLVVHREWDGTKYAIRQFLSSAETLIVEGHTISVEELLNGPQD
jgi:Uma2 family endonuclease